jgi:hypothetical protein
MFGSYEMSGLRSNDTLERRYAKYGNKALETATRRTELEMKMGELESEMIEAEEPLVKNEIWSELVDCHNEFRSLDQKTA